ncbi:Adenine methylase [Salmonella enterica subsp. enterica serovar Agona str. 63.H.87]|nr:Adenine methylase [Salmonella enterica subsp. enterica serovar Agona str. 63.H.87]
MLANLLGDVPRCELFSRDKVKGWDMWGNQCDVDFKLAPGMAIKPCKMVIA